MAKLLLINPSYYRTYGSTAGGLANPVYPVMSLAAIGGAARRTGHDVHILDMSYETWRVSMPRVVCFIKRKAMDVRSGLRL